jgi:voltage-gated potassium channel
MNIRRRLLYAIVLLLLLVAVAVNGYRALGPPGTSLLDALYMVVITLAGVGYGEIVSTAGRPLLRIFNMFVIMVGVMITLYVFSAVTAFLVEGELSNIFWRRKLQKRISELRHHFIVCGLGATGRYAVEELHKTGTPYVVVESNEETVEKFRLHHESFKDMLYIVGDATDEEILDQAGLAHAKGVIAGVASEKDNLVITVMVRQKHPKMRVVARYADVKYADRLIKAGASAAVSPNQIGGLRMASEALRPHVTSFLDLMLREQSRTLRIEEIDVAAHSPWVGRTLEQISLRSRYNLLVLAVKIAEEGREMQFLPNPPDSLTLLAGAAIIVMGDMTELRRARHEAQHDEAVLSTEA